MKTVRYVFVVVVVALLVAAFAPMPGGGSVAAGNTLSLNTPAQSFVSAALGLPLLAPMTVSASAPLVSITVDGLRTGTYACKIVSQTPADWTKMKGRQYFDAKWTLLNTGTAVWNKKIVDYKYISGAKMHTYSNSYDLPVSVGVGKKIAVIVDMTAPKYNGVYKWYTAYWGLFTGSKSFCKFSITIVVNR